MQFQQINGTDPEKVFIIVKNGYSTGAFSAGNAVAWDYTTAADGITCTQPTTALLALPAGIVKTASIAYGDYGLVQVYGHCTTAYVDGSSGTAIGSGLVMQNGSYQLIIGTAITPCGVQWAVCGQAHSTGAAAAKKVFLRCM